MKIRKDIYTRLDYTEGGVKLKKVETFKRFKKLQKGMERYFGCPNSKDGWCDWADFDEIDDLLIEFIKAMDYERKVIDEFDKNYRELENEMMKKMNEENE